MMLTYIFDAIYAAVSTIFGLFPTVALPSGVSSAFDTLFGLLGGIGYFIPLDTFSAVLLFCLAMYKLEFIVDVFHYFLRKIPGIS